MSTQRTGGALLLGMALVLVTSGCGPNDAEMTMEMESAQDAGMAGMEATPDMGEMDHSQHGGGAPATRQAVHLTAEQARALGVVYLTVESRALNRTIRTVGRIEASEDRVADVTPKVDGFVERLLVATTGEAVRRGQPLFTLYSPELVAAQEELLTAKRLASQVDPSAEEAWQSAQGMLSAARRRLTYWDVPTAQIEHLEETGEVTKTLTFTSPVGGVVLEKHVVEGQRVTPGMQLYRIADLDQVWVEGDVFEQDLQFIRNGIQAHIEVSAYPGEHLMGRVSFVYPTVDVRSRTNLVRVTLDNPDLRLKPGMFATIFVDTDVGEPVVAVPLEAVIVTGERNLVFVLDDEGMLQPREVVLGAHAQEYVEILSGLVDGESIVGSANFLVDAESRLGTSGGSMPGMQHGSVMEPDTAPPMEMDDSPPATGAEHNHD